MTNNNIYKRYTIEKCLKHKYIKLHNNSVQNNTIYEYNNPLLTQI